MSVLSSVPRSSTVWLACHCIDSRGHLPGNTVGDVIIFGLVQNMLCSRQKNKAQHKQGLICKPIPIAELHADGD